MNTQIEIADVEARDAAGWTPLMRAARNCDADVILALLERGADVFQRNEDGWTALDIAQERYEKGRFDALPCINLLAHYGIE